MSDTHRSLPRSTKSSRRSKTGIISAGPRQRSLYLGVLGGATSTAISTVAMATQPSSAKPSRMKLRGSFDEDISVSMWPMTGIGSVITRLQEKATIVLAAPSSLLSQAALRLVVIHPEGGSATRRGRDKVLQELLLVSPHANGPALRRL